MIEKYKIIKEKYKELLNSKNSEEKANNEEIVDEEEKVEVKSQHETINIDTEEKKWKWKKNDFIYSEKIVDTDA